MPGREFKGAALLLSGCLDTYHHRQAASMICWSSTANRWENGARRSSGRSSAGQLAGDHHALDLVGALVDLGDLCVAHEALDGILARVAVAAEDLHGIGRDLHCGVAGETL